MKHTLLLPQTSFSLRPQSGTEQRLLARWQDLPKRSPQAAAKPFVLHDGPPFANGAPHLGTALNKVLKDFTAKTYSMSGYNVEFRPGWDCHGLPTELKAATAGAKTPLETRQACREMALGAVAEQKDVFQRLGVTADWSNPYLTMDYSHVVVRTFAEFLRQGLVYFARKPVWWSVGAQTALAQMELEYQDVTDTAAFVEFPSDGFSFVAWTTTPWTLPANRALAVHPDVSYLMGTFSKEGVTKTLVVAEKCAGKLPGWTLVETQRTMVGKELTQFVASAPFGGVQVPVLAAAFVTDDSGTGVVHVAPGHGHDDYLLGQQYGLEVFAPVDEQGRYTDASPVFKGEDVLKADVVGALGDRLLGTHPVTHSYPHCWRTKGKVLSRATDQCFVNLPPLEAAAVKALDDVQWVPSWGRNRLQGALQDRPDWCVSRQRSWGVPVPVFYENGKPVLSADYAEKVAAVFEEHGPDTWFSLSDTEFNQLAGVPSHLTRKNDTLDVWLDSGVSWLAVLGGQQADLYLEAVDQHRGWFQSSLWVATALGKPTPYRTCLTHGWVVKNEEKFSKSSGFGAKPSELMENYGADLVRLWVGTRTFTEDMEFDLKEFPQLQTTYQKVRGTLRMLLGNLGDFPGVESAPPFAEMRPFDLWMLSRLNAVNTEVQEDFRHYRFSKGMRRLHDFCATEVSAVYVDRTKDSLYCDPADAPRRRAAQVVFCYLFQGLVRLVAPVLSFLADEAWEAAGMEGSVHEQQFLPLLELPEVFDFDPLFKVREQAFQVLEVGRKAGAFTTNGSARLFLRSNLSLQLEEAREFLGVSDLHLEDGDFSASAEPSPLDKCPRCWNHLQDVDPVCPRCRDAVSRFSTTSDTQYA